MLNQLNAREAGGASASEASNPPYSFGMGRGLIMRSLLASRIPTVLLALCLAVLPARAQGVAPTPSMSGGSNNYRKGAPVVDRIGKGGFWMSGTVRRAGDGAPLAGQRVQIWAHTTEGQEHEPQSHGATLTDRKSTRLNSSHT